MTAPQTRTPDRDDWVPRPQEYIPWDACPLAAKDAGYAHKYAPFPGGSRIYCTACGKSVVV